MGHDEWASIMVEAAVRWAARPSNDVREMQKTGFSMGAQNSPCPYPNLSFSMQKVYEVSEKAGSEWAEDNPMPE